MNEEKPLPKAQFLPLPWENRILGNRSNSVLIAEDDPMYRKILTTWLEKWGYRVHVAKDGADAWEMLQHDSAPELLILDWIMPGIDGPELCRRIRASSPAPYQYILLVTAKNETDDVVTGLEAGADDYLTKPFDQNELRARLRVGKRILTLQDDLIESREKLRFQATHDELTGILNRRALLEKMQQEVNRVHLDGGKTGILMLDLDHFKKINDTHGHLIGDEVMKEVARRIRQVARSYDMIGRYGGEEFLVVLPNCDKNQSLVTAERIRLSISDLPIQAGDIVINVTASVGVATTETGRTRSNELLALADAAMYEAKRAGRNRVAAA